MANGNLGDGSNVTYTVKELIAMLEHTLSDQMASIMTKLNELNHKLDEKASEIRVHELEKTINDANTRLIRLELSSAGREAVSKLTKWLIFPIGLTVIGLIIELIRLLTVHHA